MGRSIGVDLHKNLFVVCYLERGEGKPQTKRYGMNELPSFIRNLSANDQIAVEATTNTAFFVRQAHAATRHVFVVNPYQFKVIRESNKKTDKHDAYALAYYLAKGMLPVVRQKSAASARLEHLAKLRQCLVRHRTALRNQAHNLMCSMGYVTTRPEVKSFCGLARLREQLSDESERLALDMIIEQLQALRKTIATIEKAIIQLGSQQQGFAEITSIKGIGPLSGAILLSVIGDIRDFPNEKRLASYLGLVPRVEQSNATVHYGRITKCGNSLARTILVQCSLVAIKYSPYLKAFYGRIKNAKGSGKAIVATARKLTGIIYCTLKNGWIFTDFTTFTKTEVA